MVSDTERASPNGSSLTYIFFRKKEKEKKRRITTFNHIIKGIELGIETQWGLLFFNRLDFSKEFKVDNSITLDFGRHIGNLDPKHHDLTDKIRFIPAFYLFARAKESIA